MPANRHLLQRLRGKQRPGWSPGQGADTGPKQSLKKPRYLGMRGSRCPETPDGHGHARGRHIQQATCWNVAGTWHQCSQVWGPKPRTWEEKEGTVRSAAGLWEPVLAWGTEGFHSLSSRCRVCSEHMKQPHGHKGTSPAKRSPGLWAELSGGVPAGKGSPLWGTLRALAILIGAGAGPDAQHGPAAASPLGALCVRCVLEEAQGCGRGVLGR